MKTILALSLMIAALGLTGCGDKSATATPPGTNETAVSSGNLATAPVDYLNAAAKSKKSMEKTIDTVALNQTIQQYYAVEGHFPKDLDELVAKKYLSATPTAPYGKKFSYDATTGELKVIDQ